MTPSTTTPSENLHSGAGNDGVIDQTRPICGWFLEPIVETAESPSTESPTSRQDRGITSPTPQTNKAKALTPEALMRNTHTQCTIRGPHVEQTSHGDAHNHFQTCMISCL